MRKKLLTKYARVSIIAFVFNTYARVAQLVEHDLAKVGAAGSSPVSRSLKATIQFHICASGSVGGARPCQGRGRGFESRLALWGKEIHRMMYLFFSSPAGLEHSSFFAPLRSLPNSVHRTLTSSLRSGPRRTDKFYLPLSNGIMIFR